MSTFASWVTQPINCAKCRLELEALLCYRTDQSKYFSASMRGNEIHEPHSRASTRLIAGHVSALSWTEAFLVLDIEMRDEIEECLCHPLLVVVVCEGEAGVRALTFKPSKG